MIERPLVSVVIPAYNAEAYIADTVDSALAQTYYPIEVLVADDGSSDRTADIVSDYRPPVRYLHQENRGPAGARNLALRHARGRYIAFLDADDVWHPEKLRVQVQLMEQNPDAGICGARSMTLRHGAELHWPPLDREPECRRVALKDIVVKNRFRTSTVIVRRAAVSEAGEFDESIFGPEDWDMWRRIVQHSEGLLVDLVLECHWRRAGSVGSDARRMRRNCCKVLRKSFADNPSFPWHCRMRALSLIYYDAAKEYGIARRWHALAEVIKAMCLWPLPMRGSYCGPLARVKFACSLLLGRS